MQKKGKVSLAIVLSFVVGLLLYFLGLYFLICSKFSNILFVDWNLDFRILGVVLFSVGFMIFMIAIIFLYKDDHVKDTNRELIIEGKADVLTIMIMTYLMIFMLIICLIFDEMIGALLFGIVILVQSLLNGFLIRYFSKMNR